MRRTVLPAAAFVAGRRLVLLDYKNLSCVNGGPFIQQKIAR
jgi:hypothetical protein